MGAGVLDSDLRVLVVVAVDQQQEVDRSPYVEGTFPVDSHRMEIVAERATPRPIPVSQREAQLLTGVSLEEPGPRHEGQPATQILWTHLQCTCRLTESRRPFIVLARLDEELGEPLLVIGEDVVVGTPEPEIASPAPCGPGGAGPDVPDASHSSGAISRLSIASGMPVEELLGPGRSLADLESTPPLAERTAVLGRVGRRLREGRLT